MSVTISSAIYWSDWPYPSDTTFDVRAESDKAWVSAALELVPANESRVVGTGTITALRPTLPNITLPATSAGLDDQTARWTVTLHRTGRKQVVSTVLADFPLPVSFEPTVTWALVRINKNGHQPLRDTSTYTKIQVNNLVAEQNWVSSGDSRLPTQGENDALVGTEGAPSTANPYVTDSDPRVNPDYPSGRTTLLYSGNGSLIVGSWVKLVGGVAVVTAITDTGGCVGAVVSGGASFVVVSTGGPTTAHVNDSVISVGDYLQISDVATGTAISAGANYPSAGQVLGRSLEASSGGLILVDLFGTEVQSAASGEAITDVTKAPYNADKTGATDASLAIQTAINSGAKRVYLPAGTYLIGQARITSTTWLIDFFSGHSALELFGDGMGKTIITVPNGVTYKEFDTTIVNVSNGTHQSVHDITFQGPATYVSGSCNVLSAYTTAKKPHFYNIEITGWSADPGAGAGCINTFENPLTTDVSTTLGTTITAGSRTVTPASMVSIYYGRRLAIGGTAETVTVTGVTATTFTAVFANNHSSSDSVTGYGNAAQGLLVENFDIHDNPKATAIVNNSTGNTFRSGKIKRVGINQNQHAFYTQSGRSVFDDIEVEGISGYGIHQYPTGGSVSEASGNVYNNLRFTDVGTQDVLITREPDDTSNGTNPLYPAGTGFSRYTIITNCLFRHSSASNGAFGIGLNGPTIFTNNVLEDVPSFDSRSPYTIVANNISRRMWASTVASPNMNFGGVPHIADTNPPFTRIFGASAYPEAATFTSGENIYLIPGLGVRKFTALDNLAGGVTLTVTATSPPASSTISFNLISGTHFTLGSDNTAAQLNATALSIRDAINAVTNVYQYAGAYVVGPTVYLIRNPYRTNVGDLTISTNQSGRVSATTLGSNGVTSLWRPQLAEIGTASATAGAATLNTQSGTITSEALTTAAGSDYVLTLTNSLVADSGAGSNPLVTVDNGTNTTEGLSVQRVTPGVGSVVIRIRNTHAADALNGTIKIRFAVF